MDNIVDVAKYLIDRYKKISKEEKIIDQMKLQKLLYFAQIFEGFFTIFIYLFILQ